MSEKYYVAGCVDNGLGVDQVEDQDAEFWTLYARDAIGESEALADFADRRSAEAAMAVYVERDALNEQVRALAAENLQARNSVSAFSEATIDLTEVIGDEIGMDGVRKILAGFEAVGNMTATDAILNEVRARAVDAYCDEMDRNGVVTPRDFAARIRAGEVPDA